jgi:hypothetical protein
LPGRQLAGRPVEKRCDLQVVGELRDTLAAVREPVKPGITDRF